MNRPLILPADVRLHPEYRYKYRGRIIGGDEKDPEFVIDRLLKENEQYYASVKVDDVVSRLGNIVSEIGKILVNRSQLTRQGIRALITSEHQFIFSAAGVAKSLYANQLFSFFRNADTFAIQFCPDTTPDDLFGAYDIEKFKRGEVVHNVEGSILTKPFAFLDEFMDGNDKLLRTLLGVLLERRFIAGNQVEEASLHTAIATSNYMRVSETTEALLDRFLYKAFITPAKDMYTLMRIDQVYNRNAGQVHVPPEDQRIEMRELNALRRIIRNQDPERSVHCPIEIHYLKNMVAAAYEAEMKKYRQHYYVSPRTISKSNDLIRANALLDGRLRANERDVENLHHLFCTLNEPLDEDRTLVAQDLYRRVFQSRLQYFHSIQDELNPLLYTFEFLCEAQKDPSLKERPPESLEDVKLGWLPHVVQSLKGMFSNHEDLVFENTREAFLKLVEPCGRSNAELAAFKKKVIELIDIVYGD